jgi:uncharacterized protein (TIGR02302 family)
MTYRLKFLISYLSLLYERIWSSFWPAFTAVFAYAGLSLLNTVTLFGPRAHAALLAAAVLAIAMALARPFRLPHAADVERKMEEAGALHHRPLAALHDKPAGKISKDALALWNSHVARMAGMKGALKIHVPRPDAGRQDRYSLRHAALILLAVGLVVAGRDAGMRLDHALRPAISPDLGLETAAIDAWVAPPDYTHLPPVFLAASQPGVTVAGDNPAVPAGSLLKIRIDGSARAPHIRYAGKPYAFTRASEKSWIAALPLEESGMLRVRQGVRELGAWNVTAIPDAQPEVSIVSAEGAQHGMTKIVYTVRDDYGIKKMSGSVAPPDPLPPEQGGRIVDFDMAVPAPGKDTYTFSVDLTSNLRAGEEAILSLTATDGAGHPASSAPFRFVLPERPFTNPLAKKIIEERKALAATKDKLGRRAVAQALSALGQEPSAYKDDFVIFLSLGSAVRRLVYDGTVPAVIAVEDLLWDVALKLEDGGLSVAARDLAEALEKLQQSLDDKNTPKDELKKELDDLQRKMQAYLQQLATELAQRMKDGKGGMAPLPPELAKKFMQNIDLDEMMRQMRQLSQGGSREEMQKMAEFLKDAVRSLSLEKLGKTTPEQAEAMKALGDLQEVIKRQQSLMDKTGRLEPEAKGETEQKEQDALREKLGDIARKMGEGLPELPDNLAKGDQAMKDAQNAFKDGKPRGSLPHQKEALDQLQKGMDNAMKQLAQQMKQMMLSLGFAPGGKSGYGAGYDPLGRSGEDPNGKQGGDIRLPDAAERRRVQEIIDELRHRSNDYQRPKVERDYLDRLLDQMN